MIVDRLDTATPLYQLPGRLARALEYLRATDLESIPPGRHDIDGDRLFALVQDYTTKAPEDCVWEAHRRYIDVQFLARGDERMGYAPLSRMREREPYDAARDVAFFDPGTEFVTIRAGMFAIVGPEDVHSPGHAAGAPALVRKVVVKALIEGVHAATVIAEARTPRTRRRSTSRSGPRRRRR
jgi:YhcH/YjgK/YiaL family protein